MAAEREMERLVLCSYLLWHRLVLIQMGFQREDISASLARVRNSLIYSGLQLSIRYGLTGCGFMVLFSFNFFQVIMTYRSICESLKNRIRVVYHCDFKLVKYLILIYTIKHKFRRVLKTVNNS